MPDLLGTYDYETAINFLGQLAGAWILTYPAEAINRFEKFLNPLDWATEDDDYIYILDRLVGIELEEWRR